VNHLGWTFCLKKRVHLGHNVSREKLSLSGPLLWFRNQLGSGLFLEGLAPADKRMFLTDSRFSLAAVVRHPHLSILDLWGLWELYSHPGHGSGGGRWTYLRGGVYLSDSRLSRFSLSSWRAAPHSHVYDGQVARAWSGLVLMLTAGRRGEGQ